MLNLQSWVILTEKDSGEADGEIGGVGIFLASCQNNFTNFININIELLQFRLSCSESESALLKDC